MAQQVSDAFTAESRDSVRAIAHNLQVSWKKESILNTDSFTIGVSTIGGTDVIGPNSGGVGSPTEWRYFDESDNVLSMDWERELSIPIGGLTRAQANVELDNSSYIDTVVVPESITLDALSNGGVANTQTSRTWSHTVSSGSNRMLIVVVMARDSSGTGDEVVLSVARDGQSFTRADTVSNATGFLRNEVWYLASPNVNTSNITVTFTGSNQTVSTGAASFFGVSTTPVTSADATGNNAAPTVNLLTNSGNLIISNMSADSSTSNTVSTGTQILSNDGSRQHAASYTISTGVSFASSFTLGGSAQWAAHSVAFSPASTSTTMEVKGRYTPSYMGGVSELFTSILPARPIIIGAGFELSGVSSTIPQFSGNLKRQPRVDVRTRLVELQAEDYVGFFDNKYLDRTALFTGVRTDEVIEMFFQNSGMTTAQYELDEGINTIPFVMLPSGIRFSDALNDIAQAENGHIFQDEEGVFHFWNYRHFSSDAQVQRIITTSQVINAEAPDEDHIINVVEVDSNIWEKRANQPIFELSVPVQVLGGIPTEIFANLDDPVLEVTGQTIVGNTLEDGSGSALIVTIQSRDVFAEAVKYVVTTSGSGYITTLDITGRSAISAEKLYVRSSANSSLTAYNERPLYIDNMYIQNRDWAASLTNLILDSYSQPENLQKITIRAMPSLQIGDLVSWQGTDWRIYGQRSTLDPDYGFVQELILLRRDFRTYFAIGISTIEGGDVIAP